RFMSSFGLTMSFSIMVSLVVSFTLTPMMCARWLKVKVKAPQVDKPQGGAFRTDDEPKPAHGGHGHREAKGVYGAIERAYVRILGWSLRHRWVIVLSCVLSIVAIPLLGKAANANFLPDEDESQFAVSIRTLEGTSLDQTRLVATRIAAEVESTPGVM